MNRIKNKILDYGKLIGEKKLSPGISGNLSVRLKDKIIITTSGSAVERLTKKELVAIDFEGNSLEKGKKPSSEKLMHIQIYNKRPDINAIMHVHSPYLSAFAAARRALDEAFMAEIVYYFGKIPVADYKLPSSVELAQETAKYFDNYNAVLMANHGFVVADKDLHATFEKLELAEVYAQTVINAQILGGAVKLSEEEVRAIEALK